MEDYILKKFLIVHQILKFWDKNVHFNNHGRRLAPIGIYRIRSKILGKRLYKLDVEGIKIKPTTFNMYLNEE